MQAVLTERQAGLPVEKPIDPPGFMGFGKRPRVQIGVDFGTANSVIVGQDEEGGTCFHSYPSALLVNLQNNRIECMGHDAVQKIGKTPPGTDVVWPVIDGVVGDAELAFNMLSLVFQTVMVDSQVEGARVIIGIPANTPRLYRDALVQAVFANKAAEVFIVEQPLAAAIGADPETTTCPLGRLIIDIGGGTAGIALTAQGSIVQSESVTIGGKYIDKLLQHYLQSKCRIAVDENRIEQMKKLASEHKKGDDKKNIIFDVQGSSIPEYLPHQIDIPIEKIDEALLPAITKIIEGVKRVLNKSGPALSADLLQTGIILAGGGATLRGLDYELEKQLRLKVRIADEPLLCVARGINYLMSNHDLLAAAAHYFNTLESWKAELKEQNGGRKKFFGLL